MVIPYVDIHTHNGKRCTENVTCILNQFPSEWINKKPDSWFSVGIHPWYIKCGEQANEELVNMEKAFSQKECIAAGEAGLDKIIPMDWGLQKEIFKQQVKLSETHNMPMIIHCVKAYSELLGLRKELKAENVWIFHGFNSSLEMARQIVDHGCMLSFGKLLCKEGSKAQTVIGNIQPGHWFLETDDADSSIESVYSKAARITQKNVDEIKISIRDNFNRVFQPYSPL